MPRLGRRGARQTRGKTDGKIWGRGGDKPDAGEKSGKNAALEAAPPPLRAEPSSAIWSKTASWQTRGKIDRGFGGGAATGQTLKRRVGKTRPWMPPRPLPLEVYDEQEGFGLYESEMGRLLVGAYLWCRDRRTRGFVVPCGHSTRGLRRQKKSLRRQRKSLRRQSRTLGRI